MVFRTPQYLQLFITVKRQSAKMYGSGNDINLGRLATGFVNVALRGARHMIRRSVAVGLGRPATVSVATTGVITCFSDTGEQSVLTLSRPPLSFGYRYKASCARLG